MNSLYPIFVKLGGRVCLVVGGGEIAAWKTRALREAGATVRVISPTVVPEIDELARSGLVRWISKRYEEGDADGHFLAIVATDDVDVSRRVFADCERYGILCNAVDQDEFCNFHVPAVARRGDIKVAVSTSGRSPAFAAHLKRQIQEQLSEEDADFVARLGEMRPRVFEDHPDDPAARKRVFQGLVEDYERRRARRTRGDEIGIRSRRGTVYLVGAGPGDPGLLTLRGRALLDTADIVFYDRLVSSEIIDRLSPDIERIYVGKERGRDRPDTGTLLAASARAGKAVVRLKGGDPFLFGRGGEELLELRRAEIPCEIVAGVSALTAVPAAANIPLTVRELSHEVVIRSGYRLPDPTADRLTPSSSQRTTFVYFMVVGRLTEIITELREHEGLDAETPIAIVQRGTLPEQEVLVASLGTILAIAARTPLRPPALLVVGEVVRCADRPSLLAHLDELSSVWGGK